MSGEVEERLQQWAQWAARDLRLGYARPRQAAVSRAPREHVDEHACLAIDQAVARLPQDLVRPLKQRYLAGLGLREGARRLRVSESTYRRRLQEARDRLQAALGG